VTTAEPPAWFVRNCASGFDTGHTVVDDCSVAWRRWGDPADPPLVLVHGGAASSAWWVPLAPLLSTGRCVVAPDLSGMGESGWRPDGYRIEQWADEVLACVGEASRCGAAPLLVGHSLGGSVVAAAAARRPDAVRAVVLCDTAVGGGERRSRGRSGSAGRHFRNRLRYDSEAEAVAQFRLIPRQDCANDWFVRHIAATSVRPIGPGGPDDPTRPAPGEETGWTWKFDWRLFARSSEQPLGTYLEQLSAAGVPAACLLGETSRLVTAEVAERLRTHLGPRTQLVWIPEAGHHLMLDQPVAFVTALRAILAGAAFEPGSANGPAR